MIGRPNLDLGFEHLEAPFDVSQGFTACDDLHGYQVRDIGDQQELSIHGVCQRQGRFVDLVGGQLTFEIPLDDSPQVCLAHRMIEPGARTTVRELAASVVTNALRLRKTR